MNTQTNLTQAQQELISLLKQGYTGRFYTKLSDWGYYTRVELRKGSFETDDLSIKNAKYQTVKALKKKCLITVIPPPAEHQ
jgi:hypothetical protein